MIAYLVYFLVSAILIFVLYLGVKAVSAGIKAKKQFKSNINENLKKKSNKKSLSDEILKLKQMHSDGIITQEEFNDAKRKLLK